jgi:DNA polymerase V
VVVFSSNYELYADISRRVMETLESISPAIEIYSIDEAFVDLSGIEHNFGLEAFAQHLQSTVLQHTGISVGVGIGSTKTLAKLANYAAKKYPKTGGVVVLTETTRIEKLMKITPVGEVWGIGRRLSRQLIDMQVHTVWGFVHYDTNTIRKKFSVVLERTQRELTGHPCFSFDESPNIKQQIVCSRSFGERITQSDHLQQAIASYTARACEKLRTEGMMTKHLTVFCRTSPFADKEPYYSNSITHTLDYPTDDTMTLLSIATQLTQRIYLPNYRYAKAGVMLSDFYAPGTYQLGLFDPHPKDEHKRKALMQVMDHMNKTHKGTIFIASEGITKPWAMKRDQVSPRYTTRWKELPVVG